MRSQAHCLLALVVLVFVPACLANDDLERALDWLVANGYRRFAFRVSGDESIYSNLASFLDGSGNGVTFLAPRDSVWNDFLEDPQTVGDEGGNDVDAQDLSNTLRQHILITKLTSNEIRDLPDLAPLFVLNEAPPIVKLGDTGPRVGVVNEFGQAVYWATLTNRNVRTFGNIIIHGVDALLKFPYSLGPV